MDRIHSDVSYAWTKVLKENISANLIRGTMNAAFVWRWSIFIYGVNKNIRDHMCSNNFFAMCYVFIQFLFIFFLLNFFLLLKEIVILKMYLLVNPLTPKGVEKISVNWVFFFFVYRMHLVDVKFYPALTRFTKAVQLKWYKIRCKSFVETYCIHWTPGYPRVDHPIARYRWLGKLLSTKT